MGQGRQCALPPCLPRLIAARELQRQDCIQTTAANSCTHPLVTMGAKAPGGIQYYKLIRYGKNPLLLFKSCCPPKRLPVLKV